MFSLCQCSTIILQCIFILSELTYMNQAVCFPPIPIANTITEPPHWATDHVIGSYVIWTCDVGYVMSGDADSVVWVCGENGDWVGHNPECTAVKCTGPAVSAFANLTNSLPLSGINVNDSVTYQCINSDYIISGSNPNMCQVDGTWSQTTPPVCQRVCDEMIYERHTDHTCYRSIEKEKWDDAVSDCQLDGELLTTVKDADTQEFLRNNFNNPRRFWIGAKEGCVWHWANNTRVIYTSWQTDKPGPSNECVEMDRNSDMDWNNEECGMMRTPICQLGTQACGDPGKPLNGQRLPDDRTTFLVGATLHFSCNQGYNITGPNSILTCQTNGKWDIDKPLCQVVECTGTPPSVENMHNVTRSSSIYKGVSFYHCLEGYIPDFSPVSVCLHNGSWSAPNFTCVSLPACYSDPCYNGSLCTEKPNDEFHCACPPGFTGITCGTEIVTSTPVITDTQPTISSTTSENGTQRTTVSTTRGNKTPPMSFITVIAASVSGLFIVMMIIIICVVIGKRRRNKPSKAAGHSNEDQEHDYNALKNPSQHVYKDIALDVGNGYELVEQRKRESLNEHTYDQLDMDMISQTKERSSAAKQVPVRSQPHQREDIEKLDENLTSVLEPGAELMTTNELYNSSLEDKDTADDVTYAKVTVKARRKIHKTTEDGAVGDGIGDMVGNDLYIPSVEPPNVTHTREKLESTEDGINSSPDNVTPSPVPTSGGVEGHDYEFDEDVAMVENELYSAASTYGKEEAGAADSSNKGSNIYVNDAYQAEVRSRDNAADDDGIYNTID